LIQDPAAAGDGGLSGQFGDVARLLQAESDMEAMLDEVVAAAIRLVPGADHASISIVRAHREVISEHASSGLARTVDELQTEVEQGPGLDTIHDKRTVRVPDMRTETRWPEYASRAHGLGVGSMLSFQLFVVGDNLGALNLFSREPEAFTEESEQVGLVLASHAAVAYASARKLGHLALAVDSRDLIGQAKGILSERYAISGDQAFLVLLRLSQTSHRKLNDLARELVTTGAVEGLPHHG
jgi:GAF domain-containing protein